MVDIHKTDTYKQLARAVNRVTKSIDADRSTLFVKDPKRKELLAMVAEGVKKVEIRVKFGVGIAGQCAKDQKVINKKDVQKDEIFAKSVDARTGYKTKSILAVPIMSKVKEKKVIGVIEVLNKKNGNFTKDDVRILKMFSGVIGMVMETQL